MGRGWWHRRGFVRAAVASAAAPWAGCAEGTDGVPEPSDDARRDAVFPQGIASGDPRPDGVLLWCRVEPDDADAIVSARWWLATDEAFDDVVAAGEVDAEPDADHTIRLRLVDLEPFTVYYYRFSVQLASGGATTETGRTKTAPSADMDVAVRFAFASCQEYVGRWYHAWRQLADEADPPDFVLFLGDYIYEWIGDPRFQPLDSPRALTLPDGLSLDGTDTNLVALTLADYRALYRQYRADPDLRRAHARFPFVIAWDDHEFTNDCWQDVANEFDGLRGEERDTARREAATRAWFEFLPVDVPRDPQAAFPDDITTYRSLRYGRHVELFVTDVRYYRDDHVVPEDEAELRVGKLMPNSSLGSRVFGLKQGFDELEAEQPPTMLGQTQLRWFGDAVTASQATWKIWGSALMVAQMALDLREVEAAPPLLRNVFYFKLDQWDGFRSERAQILQTLAGVDNVVVLSGDLHGNYVAELRTDFDDLDSPSVGPEFTVTGISSISLQEQLDVAVATDPMLSELGLESITPLFDATLLASGPHFAYTNSRAYGYAVVEVDKASELRVRFEELSDVSDPAGPAGRQTVAYRVAAGSTRPEAIAP